MVIKIIAMDIHGYKRTYIPIRVHQWQKATAISYLSSFILFLMGGNKSARPNFSIIL